MSKNRRAVLPETSDCHADDLHLVASMLAGSAEAWESFVTRYGKLLRSRVVDVSRSFGMDHQTNWIDDVTADVFSSLLSNDQAALRAFSGRSSLATYLAVISTRVATRACSKNRGSIRCRGDEQLDSVHDRDQSKNPVQRAEINEQQSIIRDSLIELPEKQREVVRLYHMEGMTYAEISEELQIPLGSVGVTLQRAEAKLREKLLPPK